MELEASKKKQRRPNWDPTEVELLLYGIENHHRSLFGKLSSALSYKQKNDLWEEITTGVNSCKGLGRTSDECISKWTHIKSDAKKKEKDRIRYRNGTGGGPPPKDPTELDARILRLIPQESLSGIPGGIEVSGVNHVTIVEVHNEDDSEDGCRPLTCNFEPIRPQSNSPTFSKKKKIDTDPYLDLLKAQVDVDKERNEILQKSREDRREYEKAMLKVQQEILTELKRKNTDEIFPLLSS